LKTFDVNESGQVHTYLIYLSNLPTSEQLYWKSFNESPKGDISKRAYQTDILGNFSTEANPLAELKSAIYSLDASPPSWWSPRGEEIIRCVHYPVTPSPAEWAEAILSLDQLLVEGFVQKSIRNRLTEEGIVFDEKWQFLRLLEEFVISKGRSQIDAVALLEPLKQLHSMRSKVKGHAAQSEKENIIETARVEHGSLAVHFKRLVTRCTTSFNEITNCLQVDGMTHVRVLARDLC
jgi:hypothetical protein